MKAVKFREFGILMIHLLVLTQVVWAFEFRSDINSSGNRISDGIVDIVSLEKRVIPLSDKPEWVIGSPWKNGVLWTVQFRNRRTQKFFVLGAKITELSEEQLNYAPPVLRIAPNTETGSKPISVRGDLSVSTKSHPTYLGPVLGKAWIGPGGAFFHESGGQVWKLNINAMEDSRIVHNMQGRVVVLADPTDEYPHGVLGDNLEAKSIVIIQTHQYSNPSVVNKISMESSWVIEGTSAIYYDWNNDGNREILITRSRRNSGGQLVIYSENGTKLAEGPSIGRSFRWRHQLCIASIPNGRNGEKPSQVISVLTPHIGGVIQTLEWKDEALRLSGELSGFTSHVIGTRNLDLAAMGRFKGNNDLQLFIPTQNRRNLGLIEFGESGPVAGTFLSIGGRIISNLATVKAHSGEMAVGLGRDDNSLVIWQSKNTPEEPYFYISKDFDLNISGRPQSSVHILSAQSLDNFTPVTQLSLPDSGDFIYKLTPDKDHHFFKVLPEN